jgi:hypothetical protein
MNYSILVYESDADLAARNDPVKAGPYWAAYRAYSKALSEAKIFVAGAGLQGPEIATTVRLRDGKRHVQDGPFADTKEKLGGFFVISVANLDEALLWASRCPGAATGSIEVRPNIPPPDSEG